MESVLRTLKAKASNLDSSLPAGMRGEIVPRTLCTHRSILTLEHTCSSGINDFYCSKTIQWIVFWLTGKNLSITEIFDKALSLESWEFDTMSCAAGPQLLVFDIGSHKFSILCGKGGGEFALLQSNNYPGPSFTLAEWMENANILLNRQEFFTFLSILKTPWASVTSVFKFELQPFHPNLGKVIQFPCFV